MNFAEAIRGVLHLLFGFNGRIERAHFWIGVIAVHFVAPPAIASVSGSLVTLLAGRGAGEELTSNHIAVFYFGMVATTTLTSVLTTFCTLALTAKRLHDIGLNAFWCVPLLLMPTPNVVQSIAGLSLTDLSAPWVPPAFAFMTNAEPILAVAIAIIAIIGCVPGQLGPNRFGPQPPRARPAQAGGQFAP